MALTDPLLESFDLRHLHLRNRIVSTSHEPAYSEDGLPKDRYRLYHREKARGGVALTMIGGSAVVSRDSPPSFGNLLLYRDDIVPWFRRLADDVHEAGSTVMCQVTHLGRRTSNYTADWLPLPYPSAQREPAHRAFPKVAEPWDLDRIVDDYVAAAQRCQQGGLDGIEIQHYGHFLDAFLSPTTNDRTDGLGGSLEQRLTFPRRIIQAVRAAVGPDLVIGIRMSMDENLDGRHVDGLRRDEAVEALHRYTEDGIEFLSLIKGTIERDATLAQVIPGMGTPSAPFLDFAGEIRASIDIPVMHAARIPDIATARHAVRNGLLDLVGMTRALLTEPHLVRKLQAGDQDRIRPCVGANYCLDAIYEAGDAKCVHNAATGREQTMPHLIARTVSPVRTAVVVGAGPAGLEAARVLGERGHRVIVLEAAEVPGGQVLLAASSPRRRDLAGIVDWRVSEAKHSGVEFRFGVLAEASDITALEPDLVVVATGGTPNRSFLREGQDLVVDSWDVMSGSARPRGDVLVYDDNGAEPGLDAAELLARHGARVEVVTAERMLAPLVGSMNSPAYLKAFAQTGVAVTLAYRLAGVRRSTQGRLVAHLRSEYADVELQRTVDAVVVEHGTLPNAQVYFDLLPGSSNLGEVDQQALIDVTPQRLVRNPAGRYQLFRIGDAVSSRNVHAAVYDALRLCVAT